MPKPKTLQEISAILWATNVAKGWTEEPRTPLENHALMHSEISEATEAVRNGEDPCWVDETGKPQGEATELADDVIRIHNYFTEKGWNLEEVILFKNKYNMTRPHKHGKLI